MNSLCSSTFRSVFVFVLFGLLHFGSAHGENILQNFLLSHNVPNDKGYFALSSRQVLALISDEYPQDPTDEWGWISYVSYLLLILACVLFLGILFNATMCIVLCCQRCGRCGTRKADLVPPSPKIKRLWILTYAVLFSLLLTLTALGIVYTVKLTDNVEQATNSTKTSLFLLDMSLVQLKTQLSDLVTEVQSSKDQIVSDLVQFPQSQILNYSMQVRQQLNQTAATLSNMSDSLQLTAALYASLQTPLWILDTEVSAGKLTGNVPLVSDLPNVTAQTNGALSNSQNDIDSLSQELNSVMDKVSNATVNFTLNANSNFDSITTTVTKICDILQSGIDASESINSTISHFDNSFVFYNNIRIGGLISYVCCNVSLFALWFLILCTDRNRVLRIPIYTATFFILLFFVFGAVHLFVWNATYDFCENHISYLQQNSTQATIQKYILPNNSSLPAELNHFIVDKILKNITLLLSCGQNQTVFDMYGTSLGETFGILNIVNESMTAINDAVTEYSGYNDTTNALNDLNSLANNVTSLSTTIDNYIQNNTVAIMSLMVIYNETFDLTRFGYNATAEAEVLSALNNITMTCCNMSYGYDNVTSINTTAPPYNNLDNTTKSLLNTLIYEIEVMNQLKLIAEAEQREVQAAINNATATYQLINQQLESLNYTLTNSLMSQIMTYESDVIAISNTTQSFITNIENVILNTALKFMNPAQVSGLGNCGAFGYFYSEVVQKNVCSSFQLNIGIEAFVFLIIGVFLFVLFPVTLIASHKLKKHPLAELKLRKPLTKSNVNYGLEINNIESGITAIAKSASAASGLASPSSRAHHSPTPQSHTTQNEDGQLRNQISAFNGPWEIELTAFDQISKTTKDESKNETHLAASHSSPAIESTKREQRARKIKVIKNVPKEKSDEIPLSPHRQRQLHRSKKRVETSKTPRSAREKTQMNESKSLLQVPAIAMKPSKSILSNVMNTLFHSARNTTTKQSSADNKDNELSNETESSANQFASDDNESDSSVSE